MKSLTNQIVVSSTPMGFIFSYFLDLAYNNAEQYLAVTIVIFVDGVFGIIAGMKREGFKTFKALKILKTFIFWVTILTSLLSIEKGFAGTYWLSETVITPFLVFQLISVLKNASMSGFISNGLLNVLLDKIDKHKGLRE